LKADCQLSLLRKVISTCIRIRKGPNKLAKAQHGQFFILRRMKNFQDPRLGHIELDIPFKFSKNDDWINRKSFL
jgi:hypothetical protein